MQLNSKTLNSPPRTNKMFFDTRWSGLWLSRDAL